MVSVPAPEARATYTVNLVESGGNVVGTGTGSLDLTDLTAAPAAAIAASMTYSG